MKTLYRYNKRRQRQVISARIGRRIFNPRRHRAVVARRTPLCGHSPPDLWRGRPLWLAILIARAVLAEPGNRRRYLRIARGNQRRVFVLAVADALRPPDIRRIDIDSYRTPYTDVVRIDVDDVTVASVEVGLWLRDGTLHASGRAKRVGRAWWFVAPAPVPAGQLGAIIVHATDLSGNESVKVECADEPATESQPIP